MNLKKGFTLVEILITLSIIGIIAAITIPALQNNINEQELKSAYKQAFAVASLAWKQALAEGTIVSRPSWIDAASKVTNFNAFKNQFVVVKDCNNNNNIDCWANGEKYYLVNPVSTALAFIDNFYLINSIYPFYLLFLRCLGT